MLQDPGGMLLDRLTLSILLWIFVLALSSPSGFSSLSPHPPPTLVSPSSLSVWPINHLNESIPSLPDHLRHAFRDAVIERERMFPLVRSFENRFRSIFSANMRLK